MVGEKAAEREDDPQQAWHGGLGAGVGPRLDRRQEAEPGGEGENGSARRRSRGRGPRPLAPGPSPDYLSPKTTPLLSILIHLPLLPAGAAQVSAQTLRLGIAFLRFVL
jgi:hypothetical protein